MFTQILNKLLAYFQHPTLAGIGIALLFGIIWLLLYWPPLLKEKSLWLVMVGSALVTVLASALIQVPLNEIFQSLLGLFWSQETLNSHTLLSGLPSVLVGGLVLEGAKIMPVIMLWKRSGRTLNTLAGLLAGALAGIGFGVIEAQWVCNSLFTAGWSWSSSQAGNLAGFLTFWERLVMVGMQAGLSALVGYGLARGKGWKSYLVAVFIHALASYSTYLLAGGAMSVLLVEVYLTAVTAVLAVVMLSVRWEKT